LAYHEFIPAESAGAVSPAARKGEAEAQRVNANPHGTPVAAGEAAKPLENSAAGDAATDSFAVRQTWLFGIGLAAIAVVLAVAGLFLARRQ
jgi:hypothetical protein